MSSHKFEDESKVIKMPNRAETKLYVHVDLFRSCKIMPEAEISIRLEYLPRDELLLSEHEDEGNISNATHCA